MNFKKVLSIAVLSALALSGCNEEKKADAAPATAANKIKVGVMSGPEHTVKGLDNLVIVGNTFVYPLAGYSKKIKSVNELADGAVVAVPNDPSNLARALILLEKQGLIKLKDNTNLFSTTMDIIENPKHLKVQEVDTSVAAKALDDVDLAVVNNTYAGQVGLSSNDGIFVEDKDSPYVNIIVARKDNKDTKAVQDFVKAYQTDEVYQEAQKHFKDGVVKGW